MRNFILITFLAIILVGCSRNKFLTADYDDYGRSHQTIAVLPYDIHLRGRKAADLDFDEISAIQQAEGKLFQQSLYTEILKRTGRNRKDIVISIQPITKTNRRLENAGINLVDVAEYTPKELGDILGVDAIVLTSLIKEMFLSREEALVVNVAQDVIINNVPLPIPIYDKRKVSRSMEVDVFCTIVDVNSERPIWVYNTDYDLQWNNDPDEAIERINRRVSRKFPYRKNEE